MEENLPPGFRFHPTDEELITYYLTHKVSDFRFSSRAITDVDLNKCEPWDLPGKATMGEKEWYFFSLRDRKYPTGLRTNRATDAGYWKTTGKDKEIFHSGVLVGLKKTLVFYKGRAPRGEKSNWVMHEYRLETKYAYKANKEEWVVCRVFQKSCTGKKPMTAPTSSNPSLESTCEATTLMNELGEVELPHLNNLLNSSSCLGATATATATATANDIHNSNGNNDNSVGTTLMNWISARDVTSHPSAPWPSNLLGSNLSMSSMLLRTLQLGSYQPREATIGDLSSLAAQGSSRLITDSNSNPTGSSSMIMDSVQQQPFNLDSLW